MFSQFEHGKSSGCYRPGDSERWRGYLCFLYQAVECMEKRIPAAANHKKSAVADKFKRPGWPGYRRYFPVMKSQIVMADGILYPGPPGGGNHSYIVLFYIKGVVINFFNDPVYIRSAGMNKLNGHAFEEGFERPVFLPEGYKIALLR